MQHPRAVDSLTTGSDPAFRSEAYPQRDHDGRLAFVRIEDVGGHLQTLVSKPQEQPALDVPVGLVGVRALRHHSKLDLLGWGEREL